MAKPTKFDTGMVPMGARAGPVAVILVLVLVLAVVLVLVGTRTDFMPSVTRVPSARCLLAPRARHPTRWIMC